MRSALCLALLLIPASAHAQDVLPANPKPVTTHTYIEGRIGAVGFQPLGTREHGALQYGPAFELGAGIGFRWLDLGLVGRYGTIGTSYAAVGPEIAVRKSLGDGATLRFGVIPLYAVAWDSSSAHSRIGADAVAQFLFTIDNKSRPAWRVGAGLRAGRWATLKAEDPGWSLGVDLLVRSWW
jgi:hypothetical protein